MSVSTECILYNMLYYYIYYIYNVQIYKRIHILQRGLQTTNRGRNYEIRFFHLESELRLDFFHFCIFEQTFWKKNAENVSKMPRDMWQCGNITEKYWKNSATFLQETCVETFPAFFHSFSSMCSQILADIPSRKKRHH